MMESTLKREPAPVVMIVFNRPDHTHRVLQALSENTLAADTLLYVYSDAPRGPQDAEAVAAVRSLVHQANGFKRVTVVERPQNVGCSRNVLSAVEETLNKQGRCIVVEDDVMPYPLFLSYMNEALDLYEEDSTVFSIGAYTHPFSMPSHYQEETFLLYRSCSWGWGTWKSMWDKIDLNQESLDAGMADPATKTAFSASGDDLLRTYKKTPGIWDLRICYQQWSLGLKTLFPVQSMVMNIGRDGSGTHYNQGALHSADEYQAPLRIPILHRLSEVDEEVRDAFIMAFRKPIWRTLAANLAKRLNLYETLLRLANKH